MNLHPIIEHFMLETGLFFGMGGNRFSSSLWLGLFPSPWTAASFEGYWTSGGMQHADFAGLMDHLECLPIVTHASTLEEGLNALAQKLHKHYGVTLENLNTHSRLNLLHPIPFQVAEDGVTQDALGGYDHIMEELTWVLSGKHEGYLITERLSPDQTPILHQLVWQKGTQPVRSQPAGT